MDRRHRWVGLLIAIPGVAVCLLALVAFFWMIGTNGLPFHPRLSASEHYQAVGKAYGSGFVVGFFFCFFLMLGVMAASAFVERRRRPRVVPTDGEPGAPIPFPGPGLLPKALRRGSAKR